MKKSEIPQDDSALNGYSRELCYATDDQGKYDTILSTGWNVKKDALEEAWNEINDNIKQSIIEVNSGKYSPIHFWMTKKLMDLPILSGYTGFFQWRIKRHLKPKNFDKLSTKTLAVYANAFEISIEELKNKNEFSI